MSALALESSARQSRSSSWNGRRFPAHLLVGELVRLALMLRAAFLRSCFYSRHWWLYNHCFPDTRKLTVFKSNKIIVFRLESYSLLIGYPRLFSMRDPKGVVKLSSECSAREWLCSAPWFVNSSLRVFLFAESGLSSTFTRAALCTARFQMHFYDDSSLRNVEKRIGPLLFFFPLSRFTCIEAEYSLPKPPKVCSADCDMTLLLAFLPSDETNLGSTYICYSNCRIHD